MIIKKTEDNRGCCLTGVPHLYKAYENISMSLLEKIHRSSTRLEDNALLLLIAGQQFHFFPCRCEKQIFSQRMFWKKQFLPRYSSMSMHERQSCC